jgi:Tfp pilus assembly protein PilX
MPQRQAGLALVFVLVALAVLAVSALALIRSSDVSGLVAGNIAFRQGATQAAELGVSTALATIADPAFARDDEAVSYFPVLQPADAAGLPAVDWDALDAQRSGPYNLRWVAERLCNDTPVTDPDSQCQTSLGEEQGNSIRAGAPLFSPPSRIYYRITVRADGPKGTTSFVQALVAI